MSDIRGFIRRLDRTRVRLTLSYVAVVMFVSLIFSVFFYITSVTALHVSGSTHLLPVNDSMTVQLLPKLPSPGAVLRSETAAIEHTLLIRLIFLNGAVLIVGSYLCYYLARRTLHPVEMTLELQERFISDASHELKTPITGLRLRNEVALRDPSLSLLEAKDAIKENVRQAIILERLTANLLRLAKDRGSDYSLAKIDLGTVIEAAIEQCRDVAQAKSISLVAELSAATVLGAEEPLTQVFVILLDNAIKFSQVGSMVRITSFMNKKEVVVVVCDEGQGIADVDVPHIFERFYQGDSSRAKQGSGLGLSIADNIIRHHNGKITVQTALGKGSEFSVYIPFVSRV